MRFTLTLLLIALLGPGCVKDELEGLTYNPFDPAYDGPPVFSLETSYVDILTTPQGINRRLTQRMRMDRSLLLRNTTFVVQCVRLNDGTVIDLLSNSLEGDLFNLVTDFTQQGAEYCWELRLTNQGSIGARNNVCSTAD